MTMTHPTDSPAPVPPAGRFSSEGLSAGELSGLRVQIDWSLLIVFALVFFGLASGVFPVWHPDWAPAKTWLVALAAAVLFFVSVLLHELSHALVARANGITVRRITLFLFGGVTHMESEPPSPKSEFLMAIVGPLTSLSIGFAAFFSGAALAGDVTMELPASDQATLQQLMMHVGPVASLLLWLGPINIMLGLFNLVPGFPLDGGRVLRSLLWWMSGDLLKATRWASLAGRVVAWALMALGVMSLLSRMGGQGLWLILIGWFLNAAARSSYQHLTTKHALHEVSVRDVMWTQPVRVAPELTLERFVQEHLMQAELGTFAVEADGALLGLITLDDVRKVPQDQWSRVRVEEVMTPRERLATLTPSAKADRALDELARRDVNQIPVLEGGHLAGIVRHRDLVRWLAFHGPDASAHTTL
jgi:Zn-dependent protease/predicted transcriptional regulator